MATSIEFEDADGVVTVTNGAPSPGDRFTGWQLLTTETENGAGVQRETLAEGITHAWIFRTDYGAKFALRYIPNADQTNLTRLKRWLESGGTVTVNTGDSADRSYTCYLWPRSKVDISPPNAQDLRLTVTLSVLNAAQADCVCTYP